MYDTPRSIELAPCATSYLLSLFLASWYAKLSRRLSCAIQQSDARRSDHRGWKLTSSYECSHPITHRISSLSFPILVNILSGLPVMSSTDEPYDSELKVVDFGDESVAPRGPDPQAGQMIIE